MGKMVDWSKHFDFNTTKIREIKEKFGGNKVLAMGVMPIRGPKGFRKLDYEYAKNDLNVKKILDKLEKSHFNLIALTIKDADGACLWDTKLGWNPTNRDILGEFCDALKDRAMLLAVSFTSMNDAYQGHIHPDRVSVHGKDAGLFKRWRGNFYKVGDISTHEEGEMRVDLPNGVSIEEYQEKIPFLTKRRDSEIGKARWQRGSGYIPTSSFMCPNSEHANYLVDLAEELTKNYKINFFVADYIRYDGKYKDLCLCERCKKMFREKYGEKPKYLKSSQWLEFKDDSIASYAKKLHKKIKSIDKECLTGWACLPEPFAINRIGQSWEKLSTILDVVAPMEYPYLMGTYDDGWKWGKLGDIMYWYFTRFLKKRVHKLKSPALAITNSVECNAQEMLKQMRGFDFGLGIALFKYYGTKESQWAAVKKYAEEEIGLENLNIN
jgi:hypothetical protein